MRLPSFERVESELLDGLFAALAVAVVTLAEGLRRLRSGLAGASLRWAVGLVFVVGFVFVLDVPAQLALLARTLLGGGR